MTKLTKVQNGVVMPLSAEEIIDFNEREALHLVEQAALALVAYKEKRRQEYPSLDAVIVAMMEDQLEGRPEALLEIKGLRAAIKLKYPKPA